MRNCFFFDFRVLTKNMKHEKSFVILQKKRKWRYVLQSTDTVDSLLFTPSPTGNMSSCAKWCVTVTTVVYCGQIFSRNFGLTVVTWLFGQFTFLAFWSTRKANVQWVSYFVFVNNVGSLKISRRNPCSPFFNVSYSINRHKILQYLFSIIVLIQYYTASWVG